MKAIDENIWVVETDFQFLGNNVGNRMTVIKLPSGKLLLHSPTRFSQEIASQLKALGQVGFIITPNNFHGLFSDDWLNAFPDATHYSAKRKTNGTFKSLSESINDELESAIKVININGIPKLNEYAFIHIPSNTLILTDLAFNFDKQLCTKLSLWSKLLYRLNDCYQKFGPSKLMRTMIESTEDLGKSIDEIKHYPLERIIVSHGNILEQEALATFSQAFDMNRLKPQKKSGGIRLKPASCG